MRDDMIKVFEAWLAERKAVVACGGQHGDPIQLKNMIYQATVWGPWLWNLFYEDARLALRAHNFVEVVFADDFNAFRASPWKTPNTQLMDANDALTAFSAFNLAPLSLRRDICFVYETTPRTLIQRLGATNYYETS